MFKVDQEHDFWPDAKVEGKIILPKFHKTEHGTDILKIKWRQIQSEVKTMLLPIAKSITAACRLLYVEFEEIWNKKIAAVGLKPKDYV